MGDQDAGGQGVRILSGVWPGSAAACYPPRRPGSTGRTGTWAPCHSFSLVTGDGLVGPMVVLVQTWLEISGAPGPSLGNRWFTKKCQEDASIKKERCVYSMISTDQMHIHRIKVKPVSDSRVWPTLRHQRRGVEWVLMAHVTSPRAPIIKLKKKKKSGGRGSWLVRLGGEPLTRGSVAPQPPVPALSPGPYFPGKKKKKQLEQI